MARRQHERVDLCPHFRIAVLALLLGLLVSCTRQPTTTSSTLIAATTPAPVQQASNDQSGALPTQSLAVAVIPKGTPIIVRLQSSLSSAVCHPGDIFTAVLDEPIVVQGETLASPGAAIVGEVVSSNSSGISGRPGYLRLTLSSVEVAGKSLPLHTSAVFRKSAVRTVSKSGMVPEPSSLETTYGTSDGKTREVKFSTGHQLKFWLVQALPVKG